ncbi:hypothetical protein RI054_21g92110 [Pseudoscourfieldia marina]
MTQKQRSSGLSLAKHAPGARGTADKAEVRKLRFKRALDVKRMAVALAHRSTPRAMETKFALRQTWASGGRAAESAYLLYTGLKWDYDQQCTVGLWPQLKTFKVKLAVFVAGIDASTCYYTDWGDVMALSQPPIFEDGEACFLNTKLSLAAHPARVLGASMKDLRKDCPELPEDVSAGGPRPGVGFSNLFEYMDASVAMAIPGAVVLAGRPALPRAQLGKAPVPADLFCLVTQGNRERMELFVDALFNMHSAAPPMLLQNGDLGPAVRACAAGIIMHYPERKRRGEARSVHAKPIETVEGMKLYDPGASADTTLIRWSAELRAKFTSDNQHLLLPAVSNNAEMAVRVVQHVVELTQQVVRMREEISELRAQPQQQTPSQAQPQPQQQTPSQPQPQQQTPSQAQPQPSSLEFVQSPSPGPPLPSFVPMSEHDSLDDNAENRRMRDTLAVDVFRDIMAKGGGEPTVGSNKGSNKVKYKLNLVLKLFGGIATDDEVKAAQADARQGERSELGHGRSTRALQEAQRACGGVSEGCASSVDFRLGDLKKQRKGSAVDLDKSTLRAWRSKHDAKMQRASVTSTGQTEEQQESPTASAGGQSSGTKRMRSSLEGWVKTIVNGVTL